MTVDVEAVLAGEIAMPRAYAIRPAGRRIAALPKVLRPGADTIRAPFLWYLLRHPNEGAILVDTGLPAPGEGFGRAAGVLFRGLEPAGETFEEQLRTRGVEPRDVALVVMTHLHADHTGGMPLLTKAEFVIGRREWRAVTEQNPLKVGAVGAHLPPADRVRQIDFEADGAPHGAFTSTVDLLGDGSVRLLSTPGHSPGHLSVLVERGGRPLLIVGDAAYTTESIRDQALPLMTDDEERYRRSLAEIKAYADAEPGAVVVPTHDPEAFRRV
jgi:glyoxylase-like metal-dependent hydrolase (beta-lactamase superfamily II)